MVKWDLKRSMSYESLPVQKGTALGLERAYYSMCVQTYWWYNLLVLTHFGRTLNYRRSERLEKEEVSSFFNGVDDANLNPQVQPLF